MGIGRKWLHLARAKRFQLEPLERRVLRASVDAGAATPLGEPPTQGSMTLVFGVGGEELPISDTTIGGPNPDCVGSFSDAKPLDLGAYSATIDWGDGTKSAGSVDHNVYTTDQTFTDPNFFVRGQHDYARIGRYQMSFTVTRADLGGGEPQTLTDRGTVGTVYAEPDYAYPGSWSAIIQMQANNALLVRSGTTFDGNLASFDPGVLTAGDYSAQIDWGDGSTSDGATVANEDGSVSVVGSHTYAKPGEYSSDVDVDGPCCAEGLTDRNLIVGADSILSLGDVHVLTAMSTVPYSLDLSSFYDPGIVADASAYSVMIDWGDGTSGRGELTAAGDEMPDVFDVAGNHAYAAEGHYPIAVTIARDGAVLTVTGSADVSRPWIDVIAIQPQPYFGPLVIDGSLVSASVSHPAGGNPTESVSFIHANAAAQPLSIFSPAAKLLTKQNDVGLDRSDPNVLG
jgi:hypothetical protein